MDFPCTRLDCPLENVYRKDKNEEKFRRDEKSAHAQIVQNRRKFHEQMRQEGYLEELRVHEEVERKRILRPSGKEKAELHAKEVLRRKNERDQDRLVQLNREIAAKHLNEVVRPRRRYSKNIQRNALKTQQAAQIRAALVKDRQEQVEDEIKSKEEAAEERLKNIKSNLKLNRCEVKKKCEQQQNLVKQRRDDLENEKKNITENEIKVKNQRTNFNLGIEEKPKFVRTKYIPKPKIAEPEENLTEEDQEDQEAFDRLFGAMYGVWRRHSEVSDDSEDEERALEMSLEACGIANTEDHKEVLYPAHTSPPCPPEGWRKWHENIKEHIRPPPRSQVRAAQLKALAAHHKKLQKDLAKYRGHSLNNF